MLYHMNENKYTQRAWDRIVGIGIVPDEYKVETKLEEYKRKINYNVWLDATTTNKDKETDR